MTKAEFNILFDRCYEDFCRYAFTVIRDSDEVEDIVQNVFVEVWNSGKIHEIEKPEHYLLRAIKFKCVDYQRKEIVKRKHEAEIIHLNKTIDYDEEVDNSEELIFLLQSAIAELPAKTQEVFIKAKQEGMSYKAIATELNISPKTVENQMTRAFKHLRYKLGKHKDLWGIIFFYFMNRGI